MIDYKSKVSAVLCYSSFFLVVITLFSCEQNGKSNASGNVIENLFSSDKINMSAVGQKITSNLQSNSSYYIFEKDTIRNVKEIIELYTNNKNEPIWLNAKGLTNNATDLIKNLELLEEDGLNTKLFGITRLKNWMQKINKNQTDENTAMNFDIGATIASLAACDALMNGQFEADTFNEDWFNKTDTLFNAKQYLQNMITHDSIAYLFTNLRPNIPQYKTFTAKLKQLKSIEKNGGWLPVSEIKDSLLIGFTDNKISALRKRLFTELGIPADTISKTVQTDLQTAIHSFQYLHDLKLTGKLDTATIRKMNMPIAKKINMVKTNLERLRWLQKDLHQPYIWVNIPKMELQYIDADSMQFKMRTVVGRTSRPTPTLNAVMSNIVINPGWSVPPTIMKEEVVPGIGKRGGSYLARRGLKAFYRGREVSGDRINASNYKTFVIQQKPGLNSALGAVKFNMPNRHAIYLHDTPHREDFVKYYRAYSSGCIRVEKPRDFATFLLQDSNYSSLKIDTFIRKKITKEVPLKKKIEVHIVYLTNSVDSFGNVMYLRDIYGKDGKMEGVWE
jgi:L,D-transpeptidase YcbB